MKVSTSEPFKVIYSIYQHEYLGYLLESYAVQLNEKGSLTLKHQNISSYNANEFSEALDDMDYQLIKLVDDIQQEEVIKKFHKKPIKPGEFFTKFYSDKDQHKILKQEISVYLERKRNEIFKRMNGKLFFEMGSDGEPTWKKISVLEKKATVLFHFRKNDDNTHYFPTIKYDGVKIDFRCKGGYIACKQPAWMICEGKLYNFAKDVDGHKLMPFLNKKFIVIPKKIEETYYKKFVAPLIASFDVYAKGFDIKTDKYSPAPHVLITELATVSQSLNLFESKDVLVDKGKMLFELKFKYGEFYFFSYP